MVPPWVIAKRSVGGSKLHAPALILAIADVFKSLGLIMSYDADIGRWRREANSGPTGTRGSSNIRTPTALHLWYTKGRPSALSRLQIRIDGGLWGCGREARRIVYGNIQ